MYGVSRMPCLFAFGNTLWVFLLHRHMMNIRHQHDWPVQAGDRTLHSYDRNGNDMSNFMYHAYYHYSSENSDCKSWSK